MYIKAEVNKNDNYRLEYDSEKKKAEEPELKPADLKKW
jgi:hypothetical protein